MSRTFDPTIQSEDIAFSPDEMVACPGCTRANPPTRVRCLYCGRDLGIEVTAEHLKVGGRRLETWERGWNLIALAGTASKEAADLLSMSREALDAVLASSRALPVARLEREAVANALREKLAGLGIECRMIADESLSPDRSPIRLRSIELTESAAVLTDFNSGASTAIEWPDLVLLVSGTIISGRTDLIEKKRRRHKEAKLIDSTETSSDEQVLDLYSRSDATGFRLYPRGFDFSCLGEDKKLLSVENLALLIEKLKEGAPSIQHCYDYRDVDHLLVDVWPVEERKDSKGLMRSGFGKQGFGSVASSSNLSQFNRYSRLQWHLL